MEQKVAHLNFGEKLWVWFEANKKQVLWGTLIVVGLGLIVSFYLWQESEKETNAGEALSRVLANTAFSGGAQVASPVAYLKVASQHGGTSAGAQALLLAGEAFFAAGRYSEAQAQFQRFSRDYAGNPLIAQALLGAATCLDAQGKLRRLRARTRRFLSDIRPRTLFRRQGFRWLVSTNHKANLNRREVFTRKSRAQRVRLETKRECAWRN